MRRAIALAVALLALAVPAAATAASCPKTSLGDVENEVMCKVCGVPLALATDAPQAQRERDFIQRLIAQCKSKQQIKDQMVAQYGSDVLSVPSDHGFDLAAYLVPALALLFGAGAVAVAASRWRRSRSKRKAVSASPEGGAATARLDADIERYDL